MATPHDPIPPDDDVLQPSEINDVPIEAEYAEEELEVEGPRRAASAEFIVDSEVGSEAALREAMDPANQSLAEALRLSFRVLQGVMVLLLLLFAVSGFTTVEQDQTGVKLLFGRIVADDGTGALTPGPKFNLPYPIGEFVLIDAEDRVVLQTEFESPRPEAMTREQAIEQRNVTQPLIPGFEGSVITNDGGLAHMRINATYTIDMPVSLLKKVKWEDTRRLVRLCVQHGAVKVAGQSSLVDLTERSAAVADEIRLVAQSRLNDLSAGVRITNLSFPERPSPPLAIERSNMDLVDAREQANTRIAQARQQAVSTLVEIAGAEYQDLVDLIASYEEALRLGDDEAAAEGLIAINTRLDSEETTGQISSILSEARNHGTMVELTLGNEARRFQSLFPAFERNPEMVVNEQWLDAYYAVMGGPGVEIYQVPEALRSMQLDIYGLDSVMNERRDRRLEQAKNAAMQAGMQRFGSLPIYQRGVDMNISATGEADPGRQLGVEGGRIQTGGNRN